MHVTIGLPMYGGACGYTVSSLLSLQELLIKRGDEVHVDIEMHGSIITKVRNRIARRFIESGNDYLIFIDADMVFEAKDILALIDSDADLCGIPYLEKSKNERWMLTPELDADGKFQGVKDKERWWVKTEAIGTGLLAIHKRCIQRMAEAHKDLVYDDDGDTLALFDFALINKSYWGEDFLFCGRWRELGGEIWSLTGATVSHIGETSYAGTYMKGTL